MIQLPRDYIVNGVDFNYERIIPISNDKGR